MMKVLVGWLLAAGILTAVGSLMLPTSVGGYLEGREILNLGLLQRQALVFQAGLTAVLAGSVFISAGAIVAELKPTNTSPADDAQIAADDQRAEADRMFLIAIGVFVVAIAVVSAVVLSS